MGDVIGIADSTGSIVANYSYSEWGECTVDATSTNTTVANANPIRYRGYYQDTETGYYYLQSRYYDPSICRFINADIPQIAQKSKDISTGFNAFAYCNNNPINNSDYSGMAAGFLSATAIGAILLALVAVVGITWSAATIISRIDYSFVADMLNSLSRTYKLKFATIKALVVGCMSAAYSYAKRIAKTTAKAVSIAIPIAVADAKAKTIIKRDKRYNYWVAYMSNDIVIVGNRLSKNSALSRIRKGLDVMSRNRSCAKSVAYIAGNHRQPKGPEKHGRLGRGYYWHYHIYKHRNKSHIFYI